LLFSLFAGLEWARFCSL